jgi:hypothetical protein
MVTLVPFGPLVGVRVTSAPRTRRVVLKVVPSTNVTATSTSPTGAVVGTVKVRVWLEAATTEDVAAKAPPTVVVAVPAAAAETSNRGILTVPPCRWAVGEGVPRLGLTEKVVVALVPAPSRTNRMFEPAVKGGTLAVTETLKRRSAPTVPVPRMGPVLVACLTSTLVPGAHPTPLTVTVVPRPPLVGLAASLGVIVYDAEVIAGSKVDAKDRV